MVGLRYKNIRDIHQVIAPQNILIDDRSIYIFDKINIDEGRLYRFNQDFSDKQLIIEVDDGECFFGRDGYVYILYADSDSIIEVYDLNGNKKKDIRLVGTAYSMDVDEMGNIFAIFMDEGGMSIRMFNNNGEFIRTLHSRNLSLLSSVYCKDQYVYIAGFSMDTPLRIEKINFMSYIMNIYDLGLKSSEYIISRMIQYNDTLIAILSGDNKDIIILVNEKSGEKYEVDTALYGIQNINDIFIQNNRLFVLGNANKIAEYEIVLNDTACLDNSGYDSCRKYKSTSYRYLTYLVCIKNLPYDMVNLYLKFAGPLTLLILFLSQFAFAIEGLPFPVIDSMRHFIVVSNFLTILSVMIKNVIIISRKRWRLDNLLDIYNKIDGLNKVLIRSSILTGSVLLITVFALLYGNGLKTSTVFFYSIISGIGSAAVLHSLCIRYLKRFKCDIKNIVFELLSLKLDDELFKTISGQVKKLRKLGVERYKIKVHFKKKSIKSTVERIKRWSSSRRKITGDCGILRSINDYIVFELNLINRDIKYSRISVIEDFICYIANPVNISSVVIETTEDDDNLPLK